MRAGSIMIGASLHERPQQNPNYSCTRPARIPKENPRSSRIRRARDLLLFAGNHGECRSGNGDFGADDAIDNNDHNNCGADHYASADHDIVSRGHRTKRLLAGRGVVPILQSAIGCRRSTLRSSRERTNSRSQRS